jgi:membrane-associated phospholipid phosphatase
MENEAVLPTFAPRFRGLPRIAPVSANARFKLRIALALLSLAAGEILLAGAVRLTGLAQILGCWPGLAVLVGCYIYCGLRPLPKLRDVSEVTIWAVLVTNVLALLFPLASRNQRPFVDSTLAAMDGRLHFSTAFVAHLTARSQLAAASNISYGLMIPLILGALFIPAIYGRPLESRRFIAAIAIAAFVTAAITALWPSTGPWVTESIEPTKAQAGVTAYLARLHSCAPVALDVENAGIVSFPSFHVVFAVLAAWALQSFRFIRLCAWPIAGLIVVSTVTTGWHYGVDVLGGFALSALSIAMARKAVR